MKPLLLDLLTKTQLETLRDDLLKGLDDSKLDESDLVNLMAYYQLAVCKLRLKYYKSKPMKWGKGVKEAMELVRGGGK